MADLLWRRKAATTHDGGCRSSAGTARAGGGGGLAKLWEVVVGLGGRRGPRSRRWRRRSRVRVGPMELWQKMVFPMKRVWTVVATRVRSRKNGRGLLKLHDDVQTCGYQDVQVMWEMLRRSEMEPSSQSAKQKGQFWRVFVRSQGGQAPLNSAQ